MTDSTTRRTSYQRTHQPTKVAEALCTSRKPLIGGYCPDCGRALLRGGRDHKPNWYGAFGWIEYYGDGSTRTVKPS